MAYVVPETVAELEGEREVERRLNMERPEFLLGDRRIVRETGIKGRSRQRDWPTRFSSSRYLPTQFLCPMRYTEPPCKTMDMSEMDVVAISGKNVKMDELNMLADFICRKPGVGIPPSTLTWMVADALSNIKATWSCLLPRRETLKGIFDPADRYSPSLKITLSLLTQYTPPSSALSRMRRTYFFPLGDAKCIKSIAISRIHLLSGTPDAWRYLACFSSTSVFLVTGDAAKGGEERPLCPTFNKNGEWFRGFHLATVYKSRGCRYPPYIMCTRIVFSVFKLKPSKVVLCVVVWDPDAARRRL
ncbi:hypothetical protein ARMGADRAFT_1032578 [Armillaria gallica]|uniref:Uncharacterized protein n=1 Tax=Armillaria gallica TaxID=47427 RepID=A0A2H3D915_ARMGA|nr:hypothetical protein ARMGADRAFT_1032578 [Armillaria gallica]